MEPVLGCQTHLSTVVLKFTVSITCVDGVFGEMHNTAAKGELGTQNGDASTDRAAKARPLGPSASSKGRLWKGTGSTESPSPPALSPVGSLQGEATNQVN